MCDDAGRPRRAKALFNTDTTSDAFILESIEAQAPQITRHLLITLGRSLTRDEYTPSVHGQQT